MLFFGLLRPDKGLDVLIEALPALVARVPGARLEVVGSPRMPIEPLQARARALGVADRITWDLRFVSDAEAAAAFARATVICLPYREIENSGVLAEALRHGVVPVTTAVGGLPEIARALRPAGARAGRRRGRARATAGGGADGRGAAGACDRRHAARAPGAHVGAGGGDARSAVSRGARGVGGVSGASRPVAFRTLLMALPVEVS